MRRPSRRGRARTLLRWTYGRLRASHKVGEAKFDPRAGRWPRRLRSVRGCEDGKRGRVGAIAGEYTAEGVWRVIFHVRDAGISRGSRAQSSELHQDAVLDRWVVIGGSVSERTRGCSSTSQRASKGWRDGDLRSAEDAGRMR